MFNEKNLSPETMKEWLPEDSIEVPVIDVIGCSQKNNKVILKPTKTIESVFLEVGQIFSYNPDAIELKLQNFEGKTTVLNNYKEKTFGEIGVECTAEARNRLTVTSVKTLPLYVADVGDDELLLGASASPSETTSEVRAWDYDCSFTANRRVRPITVDSCNYVGLVNQAMTCYLNSLLQALYMTPEFRNALYKWEFDGQNETRSIPYQLQKLFLNLQTSSKSAVETTDLTTSFGWQGSDAWHQHDIQELCRVMFDALEQKFKDTEQANLINNLYEGKMLDYVRCLECGTEKSREDTFQDIPLPVRPFGSTVAYNSVEEALRAFVQPETLEGNNQYHCEKCNKKCDAHKGLKFTKFPYLLTLHLKRFDFDYNTMHRIKLNDKVVFPEILNLNSFVPVQRNEDERETTIKCDDCSTTDSGSADDESCQGTDASSTVNGHDDNCADSDEGIDVSNHVNDAEGPYMYELFSILIHSGSASGGHYYAYIKDFDKGQWFCFNDQTVSTITEEDIRKTYGGGPHRGYYSGAYSSSTNAYMLMYRQIDKERNCKAMAVEDFPSHIQQLLWNMRLKEQQDQLKREIENDKIKVNVYCVNPNSGVMQDVRISFYPDSDLENCTQFAHQRLKLNGVVPVKDCRLVVYNKKQDCIDCSFESNEIRICDISTSFTDLMLEIREKGQEWKVYKSGGINMKVYPLNLDLEELEEPTLVRVDVGDTVGVLKQKLADLLGLERGSVEVVLEMYSNEPKYLDSDDSIVNFDSNCCDYKLYVSNGLDKENSKGFQGSKLAKLIERFVYVISLNVTLPDTDFATLESLSIPPLDLNQNLDKLDLVGESNSPSLRVSPGPGGSGDGFDQSNSEDSSLSDSDRTLVGEPPDELPLVLSSLSSPVDQHMASPSEFEDLYNDHFRNAPNDTNCWGEGETQKPFYFKVTSESESKDGSSRGCKLLADKRMSLGHFKKCLEGFVKVPVEYFKVFKQFPYTEWSCLTDTLRSARDGEKLVIELGRVLGKDEYKCKIYHLRPDVQNINIFLFEHIIAKGQTVQAVKKEVLIQAKKALLNIQYNKCRLREKNWKVPKRVYTDNLVFGEDIPLTSNLEMYLQELDDVDAFSSSVKYALFVRRWSPSTLTLEPLQELLLETNTLEGLKKAISDLSSIPVEFVKVALTTTCLPCDMHNLDIQTELNWNANVETIDQYPISAEDGSVFFYRDSREELKELTSEERREINRKENIRLGRISNKSYSPGRERALKIYLLDSSPSKSDEITD